MSGLLAVSNVSKEEEGGGYVLRPYQEGAVSTAVRFFQSARKYNAVEMLPTGSGKSLVIAVTAQRLNAPVLIFQPSKEILEQNYNKYRSYGYHAGIYSASMDRKDISKVTFATIGSVKNRAHLFQGFRHVIIDEAHFVNSQGGMYHDFLKRLPAAKVLGLTATPYRLVTDGFGGSILKFLTRTRPRVFEELIYYVQNGQLFRDGFLANLKYVKLSAWFDRSKLQLNSTGADFTDQSVRRYYRDSGFPDLVVNAVRTAMETRGRRNALVFTRFVDEARYLCERIPDSAIVTAESSKHERENVIAKFKTGKIKVVANVGVLSTGFDYPELETVVLARPTMSLALYYQMIGRGIRPHPEKEYTEVLDMCGNGELFGKVEDLKLVDDTNGKYYIAGTGEKQLTNIYFDQRGAIGGYEAMRKEQEKRKENASRYGKKAWRGKRGNTWGRRSQR
jgi:DNA repair protein RadD